MAKMMGNLESRMGEMPKINNMLPTFRNNIVYDLKDIYNSKTNPLYTDYTGHIPV